jgi:glycosyltransferase involved in cell wall biosynthesis
MPTIAYLANQFPSPTEPYVGEEIDELRQRGAQVIAGSVRRPGTEALATSGKSGVEILCLQPIRPLVFGKALGLIFRRWGRISGFAKRALLEGKESPVRRIKAILHTWLGAYYALLLRDCEVDHIHVHHGYFASWIGMVAASLLDIGFSLTLHGSDLLIHDAYLDTKLNNCRFCATISNYNRSYILGRFPGAHGQNIMVSRMGVDAQPEMHFGRMSHGRAFTLLSAGRLHRVKNQAFLVRACALMRDAGVELECLIAGAGPEHAHLDFLIAQNQLEDRVHLLGQVPHSDLDSLYRSADLFVLTSISEGIPLVLMEAMVRGTVVLAPDLTGIPELVIPGKTGFLYKPSDLRDFVQKVLFLQHLMQGRRQLLDRLNWIRHAGRVQVGRNFNRRETLDHFGETFLRMIG